jgi:hypothetical protein
MLSEPIRVSLLVIHALNELGVSYFVGGSLASTLYGHVRTTVDSDIIADMREVHVERFVEITSPLFYIDESSVRDAIAHRSSFNMIHFETMFEVDVFIPKARAYDQHQFSRKIKQLASSDSSEIAYFASVEDTILTKLEWYRLGGETSERQWRDVIGVIQLQENLDDTYLRKWAIELDVIDLLERAFEESQLTSNF